MATLDVKVETTNLLTHTLSKTEGFLSRTTTATKHWYCLACVIKPCCCSIRSLSFFIVKQKGGCRYNPYFVGATMKDVSYIKSGSEKDLMSAVGLKGPVVVAIDHRHQSFQFYSGGLYSESSCSNNFYLLSHEMVAVGYGTNNNGYEFWILRNRLAKLLL